MGMMNLVRGRFNPHSHPAASFDGKTILLTGGSDGLGLEAAVKFLQLGASSVTSGARNIEKANKAKAEIEQRAERPGTIQIRSLDMNNYKSVAEFADRAGKELPRLDVAMLNAGLMHRDYTLSPDGWEETLQVNTLSTIFLAILLLPQLRASSTEMDISHLVFTSSSRFKSCTLEELTPPNGGKVIDYLNAKDTFRSQMQYSASKLLSSLLYGIFRNILGIPMGPFRLWLAVSARVFVHQVLADVLTAPTKSTSVLYFLRYLLTLRKLVQGHSSVLQPMVLNHTARLGWRTIILSMLSRICNFTPPLL
jgi:NAD(P)-dependent dehydrogenase (short-subunit alcohol dehydrogenase family)